VVRCAFSIAVVHKEAFSKAMRARLWHCEILI
jgi:hypothetical protein